jgi:hypothetical protein
MESLRMIMINSRDQERLSLGCILVIKQNKAKNILKSTFNSIIPEKTKVLLILVSTLAEGKEKRRLCLHFKMVKRA